MVSSRSLFGANVERVQQILPASKTLQAILGLSSGTRLDANVVILGGSLFVCRYTRVQGSQVRTSTRPHAEPQQTLSTRGTTTNYLVGHPAHYRRTDSGR
jgi:hypothetical protein